MTNANDNDIIVVDLRIEHVAEFDSDCPGCGNEICAGDEIFKVYDVWVCAECSDDDRLSLDDPHHFDPRDQDSPGVW